MGQTGRWRRLTICGLIAGVLYLPGLGSPALWEPDEGRYAEIAREMLQSADYITPRNDWVRYFEKPPLMYWVTAASIWALGENEFAVRLPAALFSIGEVIVTCALAETMFGAGVGMFAAMALALSPLVWGFARFLTLDPALAFFVTAALGSFWAAAAVPGLRSQAAHRWMLMAAAMIAMGTLTKGPVALVICGGVALAYMLLERRFRELIAIPWFECILVYAAIVLPWFAAVAAFNPEFLGYFFLHEHLHRYLANTEHGWGPWFLFAVAAAGAWPWLYFVPLGIANLSGGRASDARESSALRFLSVWFLFVLIFFSIPRSKLGTYILPAMPPLAIVAGYGLNTLIGLDRDRVRRLLQWFAIINAIVAAGCAVALAIAHAALGGRLVLDGILAAGCLAIGGSSGVLDRSARERARGDRRNCSRGRRHGRGRDEGADRRCADGLLRTAGACDRACARARMRARIVCSSGAIVAVLYPHPRGDGRLPGRAGRRACEPRRREELHGQGRIAGAMGRAGLRRAGDEPSRLRRAGADPQAGARDHSLRRQEARAVQPPRAGRREGVRLPMNRIPPVAGVVGLGLGGHHL